MGVTNTTGWTYLPLYAMGFEQFPAWRSHFIDNPHFEGIPLPPAYAGRRPSELSGLMAAVTNSIWLTKQSSLHKLGHDTGIAAASDS